MFSARHQQHTLLRLVPDTNNTYYALQAIPKTFLLIFNTRLRMSLLTISMD